MLKSHTLNETLAVHLVGYRLTRGSQRYCKLMRVLETQDCIDVSSINDYRVCVFSFCRMHLTV